MNNDKIIENDIFNRIKMIIAGLTESQFRKEAFGLLLNSPFAKRYSNKRVDRITGRFTEIWEKYRVWLDEEAVKCELE
jgi:hypothetical protein